MPKKQNSPDRMKELTDKLENGMKDLLSGDKYREYLKSMSYFHEYSRRNIMLITLQKPNATRVASFKLWKDKFNRQVKKGEKAIWIYAPYSTKVKSEKEKLDPETEAPLISIDGRIVIEVTERTEVKFRPVPVFDASQTEGDPLPHLVEDITGNVANYEAFVDALKAVSALPIYFEPLKPEQDGYCRMGSNIGIREGMSEVQTISVIIHEIVHERVHDKRKIVENEEPKSKTVIEVEAESIAYVVCQRFGIETSANSFGYIAEWGSRDMSELKESLDTIRKEASSLITAIEEKFNAFEHKNEIPVYKDTIDTAIQNNEAEAFHFSRKLNAECGQAIDQAIKDSNNDLHRYDLKTAVKTVIDEYGADRVAWVLASNVHDANHDGRFSNSNKAWANEFDIQTKPDHYIITHPSILNGFVDRFRKEALEKPSLLENLKNNEQKSKQQFEKSNIKKAVSKNNDLEV